MADEVVRLYVDRRVGFYRDEEFAEDNLFGIRLYFCFQSALELVGVCYEILDSAPVLNKAPGCLLSNAGASGNIVGGVPLESQKVNDALGFGNTETLSDELGPAHFEAFAAERRAIHEHVVCHELGIIFVGRHHIRVESGCLCPARKCADHVVGLISGNLDNGNFHCAQNAFDPWN